MAHSPVSQARAESALRGELERMIMTVEEYAGRLETVNAELVTVEEANQSDDATRQIAEYEDAMHAAGDDIPAEDVLDHVIRLQNQLKIAQRRNQMLGRETANQKRHLDARRKVLLKLDSDTATVERTTGYHESIEDVDFQSIKQMNESIREMKVAEERVRQEMKSEQPLIRRLEKTLVSLRAELDGFAEQEARLNMRHNDVLVKQRECREVEAKLARFRKADANMERALVQMEGKSNAVDTTVAYMESDKDYLREAVAEMKLVTRRQDTVVKAQLARQQQLQERLDIVVKSLREMRLEKEFERNAAKSALVPSASREEPEDVEQILPAAEAIPIDTYRLLYKNNEMMRTNVARKNMLVLEKESAIQALEAKLETYIISHNEAAEQKDAVSATKGAELTGIIHDIEAQQAEYDGELEALRAENRTLQLEARKMARKPPTSNGVSRRTTVTSTTKK